MKELLIISRHDWGDINRYVLILFILAFGQEVFSQNALPSKGALETMEVGMARVDITPAWPVRMAGYAVRTKNESDGVLQRLNAKALAFGSDAQGPSIFITVDLIGIPGYITTALARRLSQTTGVDQARLVICATHTHSGPEVGNLMNILQYRSVKTFSDSLLSVDQLVHIAQYVDQLSQKLEQLCLAALKDRRPALVAWGQGQAGFASNRRTPGGPVDVALPVMRINDTNGTLRAVLVNYACHGTTLQGEVNKMHGDWMGEAQKAIEVNHPGVMAMVAIGCAGDADPKPRGTMGHAVSHGLEISRSVEKLLLSPLQPLIAAPVGKITWLKLPFAHVPDINELTQQTAETTVKGYYARLALDRVLRGHAISSVLDYPVQTWTFGNELVMINLGGEVVVDYATRLKDEVGAARVWMNAYANDVPCYIASKRVISEGGYEAEESMYYYDKPSPLKAEVEDMIVKAVHDLLPEPYNDGRVSNNQPVVVSIKDEKTILLRAEVARTAGPDIKYMPEWKAFGWFTEADRVEWDVDVQKKGKFDVYLDWSVSDKEAGKPFVLEVGNQRIQGNVAKTGSWFTYRMVKIGSIRLTTGVQTITFKARASSPKGALMDLRSLKLVAVE